MVLKRAMQIGLREMASVARFGEQTEVGQFEPRRQFTLPGQSRRTLAAQPGGVGKRQQEKPARQANEGQRTMGFSGEH